MPSRSVSGLARGLGAVAGVGLAALLLYAERPSASFPRLPATVRVSVALTGELEVTPAAPRRVLNARALRPAGRGATGSFVIRNQTGRALRVSFRARAASRSLDGLLRLRLRAGRASLGDSTLQALRRGSAAGLRLASGARRAVRLEAWIPAGIEDYEGRQADVSLSPVVSVKR